MIFRILLFIFIVIFQGVAFFSGQTYASVGIDNTISNQSPDNFLGVSNDRLRNGNITMEDIPLMIASTIEFLLALSGAISGVALIYFAVQMQIASGITGDTSGVDKAKSGMKGAMLGFILAMCAWFLMTKLVLILSTNL